MDGFVRTGQLVDAILKLYTVAQQQQQQEGVVYRGLYWRVC